MQFQNAVITPSGIAIFNAANTDKPIKFTRFLFTDSTTRLTGQETELPANTWGNGSVDAVVGQDELQQFVIYASASNADDYGYARGYGIYAVQDNVEYLVAVANCLGDPTYVSQMSGGYTRFHLALTIKYSVNSSVLTVQPNLAGLISRAEFENWTNRVVTTHSPSGAPYGEDQAIYGRKWFRDNTQFGHHTDRVQISAHADIGVNGAILPLAGGTAQRQIGSALKPWPDIYCNNLHTGFVDTRATIVFKGDKIRNLSLPGTAVEFNPADIVFGNSVYKGTGTPNPNDSVWLTLSPHVITVNDRKAIDQVGYLEFLLDTTSPYFTESMTRVTLRLVGGKRHPYHNVLIFESMLALCDRDDKTGSVKLNIPNWWPVGGVNSTVSGVINCSTDPDYPSPTYVILELERLR